MKKYVRKMVSFVLIFALVSSAVHLCDVMEVYAEIEGFVFEEDLIYKIVKNEMGVEELEITGYSGNDKEVVIPDSIGGKRVTSIGDQVFYGCSSLKSITIPESVESIGNDAFFACSPKCVFYCSEDSYAAKYAKKHNIKVSSISMSKPSALIQSDADAKTIRLTWQKVSGITGYEVYRSTKEKSGYKKVASVKTNSYTDKNLKPGTGYYYKVCAYKTDGENTFLSSYTSAFKAVTAPDVANVALKAGKKQVKISWKKVKGAVGYEVYLATAKNGSYKMIANTKAVSYTKKT